MRSFLLLAVALAFVLPAFACREEGPLEKAGKQMDEAIEESKEDWQERNR